MSHIVVYQSDDGSSGFEQCGSLDDAVVVAERLRNVEGVESPRIFRMEEVHIDFRPYYRVEVAESESVPDAGDATSETGETSGLDDLPAPPTPEAVAEAEAQTGAQMSADEPAWVDPNEAASAHGAPPATDEAPEPEADAPASGPVGSDEGAESEAPSESDGSDDDAMISVRRGLFGR